MSSDLFIPDFDRQNLLRKLNEETVFARHSLRYKFRRVVELSARNSTNEWRHTHEIHVTDLL